MMVKVAGTIGVDTKLTGFDTKVRKVFLEQLVSTPILEVSTSNALEGMKCSKMNPNDVQSMCKP